MAGQLGGRGVVLRRRRFAGATALATLLTLSTAACTPLPQFQAEPSTPTPTTATATSAPATTTSAAAPAPVVWPLTGVATPTPIDRPALAVMIDNSADARPQTGLNSADMVWEHVVEGGITRYVAVYQSTLPAKVGPVRSVRPMDPAIAAPLKGLLAYTGGQQMFLDAVARSGVQALSMDDGVPGFVRSDSRPAPHDVYATPQRLLDQANDVAGPPPQFAFARAGEQPSTAVLGTPANVLTLDFSAVARPEWAWSSANRAYLRSEGSAPAMSADGGRIAATNVVVLRVDVVLLDAFDAAGNRVPETVLTGSGPAIVASAGKAIRATWSKGAVGDAMSLVDPGGRPVRLAPGNTWIELVPNGTGSVLVG